MEETITAEPSLSSWTPEYVDYGEDTEHNCLILVELKALAAVCMAISFCGLVGNGLVMSLLSCFVRRNPLTMHTGMLAFTDFLMLLLCFLLMMSVLSFSAICLSDLMALYIQFVYTVVVFCQLLVLPGLGFLAAVSMEQFLAVFFPTWYHCHRPKLCSDFALLMIMGLNGLLFFPRSLRSAVAISFQTAFPGVAIAICTVLSSLILVSNLALFIRLQCGSQRRPPGKLQVAVLLSVIIFFAIGIPFTVEVFLYLPRSYALFPEMTSLTPFLLASLNSSIRPVLYFLLGSWQQRRFQCSLKVALQRVFEEEASSEERRQEPGGAEESVL